MSMSRALANFKRFKLVKTVIEKKVFQINSQVFMKYMRLLVSLNNWNSSLRQRFLDDILFWRFATIIIFVFVLYCIWNSKLFKIQFNKLPINQIEHFTVIKKSFDNNYNLLGASVSCFSALQSKFIFVIMINLSLRFEYNVKFQSWTIDKNYIM